MNKFKLYKDLQTWIEIGSGVPDMIYDSPHQNASYAPYVVEALLKNTPKRAIPIVVLESIESELLDECPEALTPTKKWYQLWKK